MHAELFLLVCLACGGCAHDVEMSGVPLHDRFHHVQNKHSMLMRTTRTSGDARVALNPAKVLAKYIFAMNPAAAFSPNIPALGNPSQCPQRTSTFVKTLARDSSKFRRQTPSTQMIEADKDAFDAFRQRDQTQGLAAWDNVVGSGDVAKKDDVVVVSYVGTLLSNGLEFDEGEIAFKLGEGRVILGWEKGIEGMRVGGTRTLRIPARMGYGSQGAGAAIPPNSDLEFECELKKTASGLAGVAVQAGIGPNGRTAAIVLLLLTVLFPDFFNSLLPESLVR